MEPSNLVKVVGAFVAGVVVALGSAVIYVRVSDMVHPRPVAQSLLPSQPAPVTDTMLPVTGHTDAVPEKAVAEKAGPEKPKAIAPAPAAPVHETAPIHKISSKRPRAVPPPIAAIPPSEVDTSKYEPSHATADITQSLPPANLPAAAQPPVLSDPAPDPAPTEPAATTTNAPVQQQPHVVTLAAGTSLIIRLGETLSTNQNYTGDTFRGTLESPVVMEGFIIADKGSKVLGKIVNADKAGHMAGVAGLTLALTEINTTDGQRVRIQTNSVIKKAPSNTGEEAAKIAGGAALGAIIGAVAGGGKGAAIGAGAGGAAGTGAALLSHGKPAVFPTESRLEFRLANPVTITEKLNN